MMDVLLKLEPSVYVMNVIAYRWRHAEAMASAGDCLGVDCPGGRKKAARQQAQLPLVLGGPAISPRISPTTVNITRIRGLLHRF